MEKKSTEFSVDNEKCRLLFDHIPGATAIFKGADMEVLMVNNAMLQLWGKDECIIGKPLLKSIPELEGQQFIVWLNRVYSTGEAFTAKAVPITLITNGKSQTFYVDLVYKALKKQDGCVEGVVHSATDVTEHVLAKQQLGDTDKRLRLPLKYAFIGTWNFDLYQHNLILDDLGKQLFGLEEQEPVSSFEHTLRNVHPDDVRDVYNVFLHQLPNKSEVNCDIRFRVLLAGGQICWIHCSGNAVFSSRNKKYMFAGIVRDVTKEVSGMEEQQRLQIQKDNFLSIASHELKTPVTSIKAYAQLMEKFLLKDGDLPKAEIIKRLISQVNRLNILLDDLFDVSNIRTNRLSFNRNFYSFNDTLKDIIRDIDLQDNEHQIVTELGVDGEIYGDEMRLSQVVNNLVSNAIKYSPNKKTILITTTLSAESMTFKIKDYGIGISEENLKYIFDQFYRVSTPDSYSYQGLGLGLFISAEIIKQEGGDIWVESEENTGSIFCFSLPLNNNLTLKA